MTRNIKALLIIAGIAAATPASASNLLCALIDQKDGSAVEFVFRPVEDEHYAEISVKRHGKTTTYDSPRMWKVKKSAHGTGIHFLDDSKYFIFFDTNNMKVMSHTIQADAELILIHGPGNLEALAKGGCGWVTR